LSTSNNKSNHKNSDKSTKHIRYNTHVMNNNKSNIDNKSPIQEMISRMKYSSNRVEVNNNTIKINLNDKFSSNNCKDKGEFMSPEDKKRKSLNETGFIIPIQNQQSIHVDNTNESKYNQNHLKDIIKNKHELETIIENDDENNLKSVIKPHNWKKDNLKLEIDSVQTDNTDCDQTLNLKAFRCNANDELNNSLHIDDSNVENIKVNLNNDKFNNVNNNNMNNTTNYNPYIQVQKK